MPRLPELDPAKFSPEQKKVHEAILAGPRGKVVGPLKVWLNNPGLAEHAQALGAYARFNSSLPPRLSELAICITGAFWKANFEWFAHAPLAIKAGLSPQIIADLKANKRPADMQADEAAVYDFVMELSTRHEVADETFDRAKKLLGEQQVVDLTALTGTYVTIAMILAMAEEGVPPGREAPFKPGEP